MSDPVSPKDEPRVARTDSTEASSSGEELPPLPDGGLSSAMPTWLQQAPSRPARSRAPETVDVTSLTEGVDVPEWLQELSLRVEGEVAPTSLPAEVVVEEAVEVGEPELATSEVAIEADTPDRDITLSTTTADVAASTIPVKASTEPKLARAFQVRSPERSVERSAEEARSTSDADTGHGGSTRSAPLPQVGVREGLVPSRGQLPRGRVNDSRSPKASAPDQPRSMAATVLLVLLLVALAALAVWYYWM